MSVKAVALPGASFWEQTQFHAHLGPVSFRASVPCCYLAPEYLDSFHILHMVSSFTSVQDKKEIESAGEMGVTDCYN